MDPKSGSRERRLVELAARQHMVVSLAQLRALGFSATMVKRRLEAGRLYRQLPRVYSIVPRLTAPGRMMAAALSCGPGAALSHRAGAAVWALGPLPTGAIDVSLTANRRPRAGLRVHRVEALEVVTHDGFPVTTPARTLADLAATAPAPRVERAFEQADRLGLLDVDELAAECAGRRGSRVLNRLIAEQREAPDTRSELERAFLDLCRTHGIPLPSLNVRLHGFEVDAYWPDRNRVVELDGFEWHGTRRAFERDRERDAALRAKGVEVIRLTWRQITRKPRLAAAALRG